MKLDLDEIRVIRAALMLARTSHTNALSREHATIDRLLSVHFPDIPLHVEVQRATPARPVAALLADADNSGERNTKITAHGDGYFVWARRKKPFNFYIVEYCPLHSHAVMLCEQLDADDSMRFQDIREAKGWDFYSGQAVPRKERAPRERMEPVEFSFDP